MTDKMDPKHEQAVEVKAEEAAKKQKKVPATDVYSAVECHDEDTKVERPTEAAVEEAKDWVDNENRM